MGIDAVALLRGRYPPLPAGILLRTLDDGVLVFTLARFSADLEQMALSVRLRLGDALDAHRDDQGMFLLPAVAEPRATTYEGVIAEVRDAGVWAPVVAAGHVPTSLVNAPAGNFAAVMGEAMGRARTRAASSVASRAFCSAACALATCGFRPKAMGGV